MIKVNLKTISGVSPQMQMLINEQVDNILLVANCTHRECIYRKSLHIAKLNTLLTMCNEYYNTDITNAYLCKSIINTYDSVKIITTNDIYTIDFKGVK